VPRRLRILTWHVHGSYLRYLSELPHDVYLPVGRDDVPGYGGRGVTFDWPDSVHEVPVDDVPRGRFDLVLYQSHRNWLVDRDEILSPTQRTLPSIVVEHDPPRRSPTEESHPVDDPNVLLVHVTHFNDLMWDAGRTPTRVIEHGVLDTGARWTGDRARGVTVVNGIARRGRRTGADVFASASAQVPLDLYGMWSDEAGGLGEVSPPRALPATLAPYRFFFNPIRWTSFGLAVCEAMMVGLPIVGLATTAMPEVIRNGDVGFVDNDIGALVGHMRRLLVDRDEAAELSRNALALARRRFSIERFVQDWDAALREVADVRPSAVAAAS
jgi:glycosyltransferase involved in cell wall biosynthesis